MGIESLLLSIAIANTSKYCTTDLPVGCSVGLPAHAHSTPMGEML
jgi:hypothetical protein